MRTRLHNTNSCACLLLLLVEGMPFQRAFEKASSQNSGEGMLFQRAFEKASPQTWFKGPLEKDAFSKEGGQGPLGRDAFSKGVWKIVNKMTKKKSKKFPQNHAQRPQITKKAPPRVPKRVLREKTRFVALAPVDPTSLPCLPFSPQSNKKIDKKHIKK